MEFEQELQQALARREAPAGFADRVMARTHPPLSAKRTAPRSFRPVWAATLAASLLLGALGLNQYREYRAGQQAKDQLMVALGITADKLHAAQNKIQQRTQHP